MARSTARRGTSPSAGTFLSNIERVRLGGKTPDLQDMEAYYDERLLMIGEELDKVWDKIQSLPFWAVFRKRDLKVKYADMLEREDRIKWDRRVAAQTGTVYDKERSTPLLWHENMPRSISGGVGATMFI